VTEQEWDPQTGELHAVLKGHKDAVNAVCAIRVDGQDLLASAGDDGMVRLC
jgi:WD40 repeat protein